MVLQLSTSASWGRLSRRVTAPRTRDEPLSRSGPSGRLRCGREARPTSPILRLSTLRCADNFEHWQRVPCVDNQVRIQVETFTPTSLFKTCPLTLRQGERVSKPQLAETLYASLQSEFVNKGAGSK